MIPYQEVCMNSLIIIETKKNYNVYCYLRVRLRYILDDEGGNILVEEIINLTNDDGNDNDKNDVSTSVVPVTPKTESSLEMLSILLKIIMKVT